MGQESEIFKDEYGEFNLNSDSRAWSKEKPANKNIQTPSVQPSSCAESKRQCEYKTKQIKGECEAASLVETKRIDDGRGAPRLVKAKQTIKHSLPNDNNSLTTKMKNKEERASKPCKTDSDDEECGEAVELYCSICHKHFTSALTKRRHDIYEHSKNSESIKAWIVQEIRQSETCRICRKRCNSNPSLRYHLLSHIVDGDIKVKQIISELAKANEASKGGNSNEKSEDSRCAWVERKLQESNVSNAITGKWICCVCAEILRTYGNLRSHLQLHSQQGDEEEFKEKENPALVSKSVAPPVVKKRRTENFEIATTQTISKKQFEANEKQQVDKRKDIEEQVVVKEEKEDDLLIEVVPELNQDVSIQNESRQFPNHSSAALETPESTAQKLRNEKKKQYSEEPCKETEITRFWVDQRINEIRETSNITKKWPCCVCAKINNSSPALRYHLNTHLRKGEVDFLEVSE